MPATTPHFVQALLESGESEAVLERRLGEYALGILAAIRSGALLIEQAEEDLFNLDNLRVVRERRLAPALVELLERGMELDDVADLAPEGMNESFAAMTALAERLISRDKGESA
jgi:hypothetical protein